MQCEPFPPSFRRLWTCRYGAEHLRFKSGCTTQDQITGRPHEITDMWKNVHSLKNEKTKQKLEPIQLLIQNCSFCTIRRCAPRRPTSGEFHLWLLICIPPCSSIYIWWGWGGGDKWWGDLISSHDRRWPNTMFYAASYSSSASTAKTLEKKNTSPLDPVVLPPHWPTFSTSNHTTGLH